jgi:tetratricopeptide (TPR) repeat protein
MAVARQYAERALAMAGDVGDRHTQARALSMLGESLTIDGDERTAREVAEQAVAIARELGDLQLLAEQLQFLGLVASDPEERMRIHQESLDLCRPCGDDMLAASELNHLASLSLRAGRFEEGSAYLEESIELFEKVGGDLLVYLARCNLAMLRLLQDRQAEAAPLVRTSLLVRRRLGPGVPGGELIFAAACCAAWEGDLSRAARLHGAGDKDITASLENHSISWSGQEQQLREREQGRLRQILGETAYSQAYRSGAQLSEEQALDLALALARDSAD